MAAFAKYGRTRKGLTGVKAFPVIHVHTPTQAVEQSQIAINAGADGVFLIHHGRPQGDDDPLIESFNEVADEHPDLFVGMNYLGSSPLKGYQRTQHLLDERAIRKAPDALWFDDATNFARSMDDAIEYLQEVADYRHRHPDLLKVTFLGGVSFKYTDWYTDDAGASAHMAEAFKELIDVVATSGEGTGHAPSRQKIEAMGQAVGPGKLAVASGISVENIHDYDSQPDMTVLIASSLETATYSGVFVPSRVHEFVQAAHEITAQG